MVSEADCLMILSDINGLYEQDPRVNPNAAMIAQVNEINDSIYEMAGVTRNQIATGGMKTKIQAAEKATENGIATYIVNGKNSQTFDSLLAGNNPGTLFLAKQEAVKAKKHWLKHTLKSAGQVSIDGGAVNALKTKGASLLPSGIVAVSGTFAAGDSITIVSSDSAQVIAPRDQPIQLPRPQYN